MCEMDKGLKVAFIFGVLIEEFADMAISLTELLAIFIGEGYYCLFILIHYSCRVYK